MKRGKSLMKISGLRAHCPTRHTRLVILLVTCCTLVLSVAAALAAHSEGGLAAPVSDAARHIGPAGIAAEQTFYANADTWIDEADQYANKDGSGVLSVGRYHLNGRRILIRFNLTALPTGATVNSATLKLHAFYNLAAAEEEPVNGPDDAFYAWPWRVGATWTETAVTWHNQPVAGSLGDPPTDLSAGGPWFGWNVTNIVRSWVTDGVPNHGFRLQSDEVTTGTYSFYTRNTSADFVPRLVINYTLPTSTPTATRTPTHTLTPRFTPTPTNTPRSTPTQTNTPRPSSTPPATATPSPTTMPADTPTSSPTPKSGVVGSCPGQVWVYADKDSWVESTNFLAIHGADNRLELHKWGSDVTWLLLHFPLGGVIPPGQFVTNAWLELYAFEASSTTRDINVSLFTLDGSFTEAGTSWYTKPGKQMILGERQVSGNGQSVDVTAALQAWKAETDPNHGLGIEPVSDDFFYRYGSREYWVSPPVLKFWCSGSEPTPTRTPTRTPTPTRTNTPVPACPGSIYIYSDADTWVDSRSPGQTHGADTALRIDRITGGADAGEAFTYLHFPKDPRLEGYFISSARLMVRRPLPAPASAATSASVRELLQPFGPGAAFTEATTSYNNKPSANGEHSYAMDLATWREFPTADVTHLVRGVYRQDGSNHGIRVDTSANGLAWFDSREGLAKPELKIECLAFGVTPDTLSLDVAPLHVVDGQPVVEARSDVTVGDVGGSSQPVTLSVADLPDGMSYTFTPPSGTPPFSSVLKLKAHRDQPPSPGTYTITAQATAGGASATQPLTLSIVTSGDLRLLSISPVQSVYGAIPPLVENKETAFRIRVRNSFPGPVEAQIRLVLPASEWSATPVCGNGQIIPVPDGWTYPEAWGPVWLAPGDSEVMLPYLQGKREKMWDASSNPAGLVSCGCVDMRCAPDVRAVPRPIADQASYRAELDPAGAIPETDETNNTTGTFGVWVQDTRPWNFAFMRSKDPTDGQGYPAWTDVHTAARLQLEYLVGNFPISETEVWYAFAPDVIWEDEEHDEPDGCSGDTCFRERYAFLTHLSNMAQQNGFRFAVAVGSKPGGANPPIQAVFVDPSSDPYDSVLAHEFNHAVTGMADIYYLDLAAAWLEAYCEMNGTRVFGCFLDTDKPDGTAWPYCVISGDQVACPTTYIKECVYDCGCSQYMDPNDPRCGGVLSNEPKCRSELDNAVNCRANGGALYSAPDGRNRHPASPGFWVHRWLPVDDTATYFMDKYSGPTAPYYWMRVENTYNHKEDIWNADGYRNLLDNPLFVDSETVVSQAAAADAAALLVSGMVTQDGVATLDPFMTLADPALDLEPGARGAYQLRLLDSRGALLSTTGFDLLFFQTDPNGGPVEQTGFSHRIAWRPETRRIELWHDKKLLASRDVTRDAPQVTVLGPNGGSYGGTDMIRIIWTATDADGPALTYAIAASPDAGRTWLPAARKLTETTYDLPASTLLNGSYLLRVSATDGVNTGYDESTKAFVVESSEMIYLPLILR